MQLCGFDGPLNQPIWFAPVVASLIYLLPVLIPWWPVAIVAWGLLFVGVDLLVFSTFVAPDADICDPPYLQALMRDVTLAAVWAFGVVTHVLRHRYAGAAKLFAGYLVAIALSILLLVFSAGV